MCISDKYDLHAHVFTIYKRLGNLGKHIFIYAVLLVFSMILMFEFLINANCMDDRPVCQ